MGLRRNEASNTAESCCWLLAARAGEGVLGQAVSGLCPRHGDMVDHAGETVLRWPPAMGRFGRRELVLRFHGLLDGGVMVEEVVLVPLCISRGGSSFGCARTQSLTYKLSIN